ncbi:DNA polymerase delta subunit 4 isoform X2 [Bombina bombina]|uniref:DNA polymerase delta subunit 4 isoform X2 n=1 Tax=Bombina bombina TaxID=8345 RepID=UPI00235B15F9|nr:DNA polymerase delta subunit 4 isoform X2 [Bombina bombina]
MGKRRRQLTDCYPVVKQKKYDPVVKQKKEDSIRKNKETNKKTEGRTARRIEDKHEDVPKSGERPLDTLIQFDLDWHFGPCTGITRLERWQRAQSLGLSPPQIVSDLLLKYSVEPVYQYSLWHDYSL